MHEQMIHDNLMVLNAVTTHKRLRTTDLMYNVKNSNHKFWEERSHL